MGQVLVDPNRARTDGVHGEAWRSTLHGPPLGSKMPDFRKFPQLSILAFGGERRRILTVHQRGTDAERGVVTEDRLRDWHWLPAPETSTVGIEIRKVLGGFPVRQCLDRPTPSAGCRIRSFRQVKVVAFAKSSSGFMWGVANDAQ